MNFDYYYGDESNQFAFYRIPRQLITGEAFKKLSTDAKLLYGLLLDRMGLSAKNGWYDDMGRVFIYYTLLDYREAAHDAETFSALAGPQRERHLKLLRKRYLQKVQYCSILEVIQYLKTGR